MNLNFSTEFQGTNTPPDIAVKIKAVGQGTRDAMYELTGRTLQAGYLNARQSAPRGNLFRNRGRSIRESIHSEGPRYAPGGAGGGGSYEGTIFASQYIAPHVKYVYEGTGLKSKARSSSGRYRPGTLEIDAANRTPSGLFAIQKEGEKASIRPRISGQRPQQEWWQGTKRMVNALIESGLTDIHNSLRGISPE